MRTDVAIVGAGPAGCAAALHLAREGADVCIIERAVFPRVKACGEYLSAGSVEALDILGVHDILRPSAANVSGIRMFGRRADAVVSLPRAGWALPRAMLDAALRDAAVAAGARVVTARAHGLGSDETGVHVMLSENGASSASKLSAQIVIGADGAHSTVARELGLAHAARPHGRFGIGGHYRGLRGLDDHIEMFVDRSTYFAINPLGNDRANVMLVVPQAELRRRGKNLDAFLRERAKELTGGRVSFDDAELEGKRIAVGPLNYHARRFTAPRVLLAGDAAHFLDPFTGQGVHFALYSAQLAARAASHALCGVMPQTQAWQDYEHALRAHVRGRLRVCSLVGLLVRSPLASRAAAAMLRRAPKLFAPLVSAATGAR